MPKESKSNYLGKQKSHEEYLGKEYTKKSGSKEDAKKHDWSTVNKETGNGKKGSTSYRSK